MEKVNVNKIFLREQDTRGMSRIGGKNQNSICCGNPSRTKLLELKGNNPKAISPNAPSSTEFKYMLSWLGIQR